MSHHVPEADKDYPQLRVVGGPEVAISNEVQMDLAEERKHLEEQAEAEEFWAGRNLAARNSTRKAA